jgi:multidrug efflux pump subunit AcrA (membrane-fusion protein)
MKKKLILGGLALLVVAAVALLVVLRGDGEHHDEHEGHDHSAHATHEEGDPDHAAHDEDHEDEHGEEEGGQHVELTPEQRKRINLELATAGPDTIVSGATFPGETILNPDRMVHVVPRAAGIVREVLRTLGDHVDAGEVLAWIESEELAEAKLSFYAKQAEVGCCMIKLPRAKEIFENTARLLALLKKEASQEELHKLDNLEMGEYRGRLLTAYAEYLAARETYEREKRLRSKEIASGQELLEAETAHKKTRESFLAAMDTARYETLIAYGEVAQERQVAEFEAVAAEKRLRLKGADDDVVARLLKLVPKTAGLKPCLCNDPNCEEDKLPSIVEELGKDKRFAWYAVRAPFPGFVIEKHLTLGEKANGDESVFTIADTSSVWIRFNVYQKDLALVKPGLTVRVILGPTVHREGKVTYVSPVVDEQTRSVKARVVLDNKDGSLRPGLYVTVRVAAQAQDAPVVVPKSAIQVLDEKEVVFIEEGDGFEAVPVKRGASDGDRVAIISGLRPGQRYVVRGAFDLKAKIVSSGLGSHAGHGH